MSASLATVSYLGATILFILCLGGLSNQETARRGNLYGMIGMTIAVLATVFGPRVASMGLPWIIGAMVVGGAMGLYLARVVKMTQMPELVAFMHSLVGLAACLVGFASYIDTSISFSGAEKAIHEIEIYVGILIGAVTFSGSVIAFGKLSGRIRSAPVSFAGQHLLNLAIGIAMIGFGIWFFMADPSEHYWLPYVVMTALAFLLGFLIIIPIGGADMPVVISMLNSYSGWAAAGIGFSLNNPMLIISGSLVGSSGAILSYIMCRAMNRSFFSVILGGFGAEGGTVVAGSEQKQVKSGSADDVAFMLGNADSVIIVPGSGLAVARAQHAVKEMANALREKGINVRYAIHPVAGRMPGHMNVLLAEAEVPYDQVFEMEDINGDFGSTDVVLVLGANDVVNPLAEVKGSPIYGMPILEAHNARTVIVNKRSMAAGYAGLDNPLFYMDKTMMVFGDAKKVVEDIVKALE
ncbi:MAG: transhydrogenase subunit beta [Rhodocyclales bacterium]|nr:transhydrogenase subunit beta [Rhodocyclales bacterium]